MQKTTLDKLLGHGVTLGASDLHFLVGDSPSYRIDGSLRPVKMDALTPAATRAIADFNGPVYMRLLRGKVPNVLAEYDYRFELGKAKLIHDGNDVLFI